MFPTTSARPASPTVHAPSEEHIELVEVTCATSSLTPVAQQPQAQAELNSDKAKMGALHLDTVASAASAVEVSRLINSPTQALSTLFKKCIANCDAFLNSLGFKGMMKQEAVDAYTKQRREIIEKFKPKAEIESLVDFSLFPRDFSLFPRTVDSHPYKEALAREKNLQYYSSKSFPGMVLIPKWLPQNSDTPLPDFTKEEAQVIFRFLYTYKQIEALRDDSLTRVFTEVQDIKNVLVNAQNLLDGLVEKMAADQLPDLAQKIRCDANVKLQECKMEVSKVCKLISK